MKKIFAAKKVYRHAVVTFGILQPTCEIGERGNYEQLKEVIRLEAQIDQAGKGQGKQGDTEAYATDERYMEGHLVKPARMPKNLTPGIVGRIEFKDGEVNTCRLITVSQISWKIVGCDRIKLAVGAGSIARLT